MAGQSPTVAEDESHYCCDCVSSKCGADMTQFIFKFVKTVEPFGQEADVMKTGDLEPKTTVKLYIEERDCEEEMSDEGVIGEPLVVPGIDQEEHFEFVQLQKFSQVWPLTQFFLCPFCENSLICLEGKSMTPGRGKRYSLPFLPATPLSLSRTLEGLFELTRCPSRAF